jgi:hypothetical protein
MASRDLRTIAHALVLVAIILGIIAAALWVRGGPVEPRADAGPVPIAPGQTGVPDSGRQRQLIIQELQKLNGRLEAIDAALRDGKYVIETKPAEDAGGAAAKGANR